MLLNDEARINANIELCINVETEFEEEYLDMSLSQIEKELKNIIKDKIETELNRINIVQYLAINDIDIDFEIDEDFIEDEKKSYEQDE